MMAEIKKETGRHGKQAAEEPATVGEAMREGEEAGTAGEEAMDEAGHRVERLAERQSEGLRRSTRASAEATERIAGETADAFTRSGTALAQAFQDANRLWVELTQDAMKQSMEATESLLRCRNLGDVMNAQSTYMRCSLDTLLDKSAQFSDISVRVFAETTQPVAARMGGAGRGQERGARR
jgi:phasin family protein